MYEIASLCTVFMLTIYKATIVARKQKCLGSTVLPRHDHISNPLIPGGPLLHDGLTYNPKLNHKIRTYVLLHKRILHFLLVQIKILPHKHHIDHRQQRDLQYQRDVARHP
jgi:hypothetical protein